MSTNTAVTQPDPAPPARRVGGLTLRSRLVLLVLAAVLPLLIFGLINQYIAYTAYRERTSEQTLALARALASAVEQELQVRIAALQTLALSPTLHTGDLQAFRHRAEDLVAQHLPGSNILLQHENGQQIMNLALPPDTPLPARQHLDTVHKVFATGQPVVSNLFYGVRLNRPLVSIDVPVRHPDGTIVYCLSMNPPSGIFNDLIRRQQPSRTSRIAIFDSSGTTIARNVDPERSIGQKGPPALLERFSAEREGVVQTTARDGVAVMVAFSHGLRSGWTIAIGIPWDELAAPIRRSTERMLAVGAGALVLALAAALILARRIAGPIAILQQLAATIDSDSSPTAARTGLRETDSVARALQSAAAQREAAERTRVESEAWFRAIADNIPQLVWMAGQNGRIFWFNQRWYDYTGLSSDNAPGTSWLAHCHPEHAARVIEGMKQAWSSGTPWEDTFAIRDKDGAYRWFLSRAVPIRDDLGRVHLWFGTNTDVTEQRANEERLRLLAAEVDHRSKNMLALVQVLVRLTRAPDMQSLVRAITGRIGALARAHALLSESRWNGADLQRLVSEELAPFRASDRAHASGPTVALAAGAAQSVAMVLHELATNAAKYGALSRLTGRIDLTWAWDAGILVLRWSENGGPPVQQPTSFGLGTGVIERNVVQQLDGTVRFEWRLEGFACEIRLPGRALVVSRAAA